MRLREILSEGTKIKDAEYLIDQFIEFAVGELDLDQLPTINKISDKNFSINQKTFGNYGYGDEHVINVMILNRHPLDVCRTLAHELVHYRQNINDQLDDRSGEDGSDAENEANAMAAVLLRKWGRLNPTLFGLQAVEE